MEQQSFVQNMNEQDDRVVAHRILMALCESSLANEFDQYYQDVKADLHLSEDQMGRVYNLSTICRLLAPETPRQRLYKGQQARGGRFADAVFSMLQPREWSCSSGVCSRLEPLVKLTEEDIFGPAGDRDIEKVHEPLVKLTEEDIFGPASDRDIEKVHEVVHPPKPSAEEQHVEEQHVEEQHVEEQHVEEQHVEEQHVEEQHVEEKHSEPDAYDASRTSSGEKNRHPAAKAMRKLLRTVGISLDGLILDTEKYEKALVVIGNTKPYKEQFTYLGGKWNVRLGGWVFSKSKLVNAMATAESRKEQVQGQEQVDQDQDHE